MKESYWGYWLVMLGILVIGVMLLTNSVTTGTTHDYYELKETTSASLVDAIDYSYYRLYGDVKISEQKFIENFIRRFSESASLSKTYDISFYDISEVPPKVSVKIASKSNSVNIANTTGNTFDLVNKIDMILVAGAEKSSSTNSKNDTDNYCFTVDLTTTFASALQKYLNGTEVTTAFPGITEEAITALEYHDLSNLHTWANQKGNVSDDTYFNAFKYAMRNDFGGDGDVFSRYTMSNFSCFLYKSDNQNNCSEANGVRNAFITWAYGKGYIVKA